MDKLLNNAVIKPEISPFSCQFGGMTTLTGEILYPDSSIKAYLPESESQIGVYFDDYGCVSRSDLNAIEVSTNRKLDSFSQSTQEFIKENFFKNGKFNCSDRDLIILSETIPSVGNSVEKVYSTIRSKGPVPQSLADWDFTNRDPKENTLVKYYAYGRTPEAQKIADEWNKRIEIVGEWLDIDKLESAMKEGVVQVLVNAWFFKDGKYYNKYPGNHNHAVIAADYKAIEIFDSYDPFIKPLSSWEDCYSWAFKINVIEKVMTKPNIKNNTLVQLVLDDVTKEGEKKVSLGQFGLFLDGKILTDGAGEILGTFYMRNNGNTAGMTKPMKLSEWNMFDKYNLRMELIEKAK